MSVHVCMCARVRSTGVFDKSLRHHNEKRDDDGDADNDDDADDSDDDDADNDDSHSATPEWRSV